MSQAVCHFWQFGICAFWHLRARVSIISLVSGAVRLLGRARAPLARARSDRIPIVPIVFRSIPIPKPHNCAIGIGQGSRTAIGTRPIARDPRPIHARSNFENPFCDRAARSLTRVLVGRNFFQNFVQIQFRLFHT